MPATRMDGSASASAPAAVSFRYCGTSPCIWASMLPIIWQAGTYGPTASMTSGGTGAMFTAVGTMEPARPAATYSAVCTPARSWASFVDAPR